jgi:hypothetical protein
VVWARVRSQSKYSFLASLRAGEQRLLEGLRSALRLSASVVL